MPLAATVTVPCEGEVFELTDRLEPRSLVRTVGLLSVVLAAVVPLSFVARGVTAMMTVATLD